MATTNAMSIAKFLSRVRFSARINATVTSPTARVVTSHSVTFSAVSTAFSSFVDRVASNPVMLASCPTMTSSATPLRNPFITAFDTNRSSRPPRSSPKIAMNTPTMIASVATAASR